MLVWYMVGPLNIMFLSECEVVVELNETAEIAAHILSMAAIEWWVGQKVTTKCRVATREEVAAAKRRLEEEDVWHPSPQPEDPNGEPLQCLQLPPLPLSVPDQNLGVGQERDSLQREHMPFLPCRRFSL